jgi:hypothetical protein
MSRQSCEDTKVPVERSRAAIAKVLTLWGARGVQWEDDFDSGSATLRFRWRSPEGGELVARLHLRIAIGHMPTGVRRVRPPTKTEAAIEQERRRLHRVAFHWLKAQQAAIDSGLFKAETVIIPWLEDAQGRTIGEALAGQFAQLGKVDMTRRLALPAGIGGGS